ncbi:pLS20_p028 family conjugation system transmembrane protein [Lactobacillus taiwanensis]|uniref:pLS20_p028 family conjugation system transmembrane protein n=1 Tax=Lactobacillus taiwanensis TaxID=508451 RepID=UPI003530055E
MLLVDNSASHPAATSALREVSNYLHYHNILMYPLIYVKWFFVNLVYGIANWASKFMADMLNTSSLVNQISGNGQIGQMVKAARTASAVLMVLALIWVGVKIIVNREPPQLKNVVIQVLISAFLLTNLGSLTQWVNDESVSIAKGFLGQSSNVNKNSASYKTSSLPFKILSATTNDNEYLINTNFQGKGVNKSAPGIKITPNIKDNFEPVKQKFGYNDLKKSDVDAGNVNFYKIIDWNDVDDNMPLSNKDGDWKKGNDDQKGTHFLYGWLKYHTDQVPATKSNKIKWISPDIPRWGGVNNQSSLSWGGYPRYEVDWIPCIVSLLVLTVAYIFAGYVIIKSFIELVLMNILGLFLIGSDLSTGQKTKQVVSEIFSASLLISLQAFELALYEALVTWGINGLSGNTWGFMVFMIAASIMVITGSQKVTKFFGVDTGAQHGLQAAGSVMYAGKQIGKGIAGAAGLAMSPVRATSAIKNTRDRIGHTMNTNGSMKRDAKKQAKEAARQNAIDKMAGFDRNGNRTVEDFDKENGKNKNMIHQTASAQKAATQAYRKAAKGTRQADIRQRRRDAIALGARAIAGDHDGWRKATGQAGKPLKDDIKQFKEGKLMSKEQFKDELNRQTKPNSSGTIGAVNQTGPTSLAKYHDWQNRAKAYDKENGLTGSGAGVSMNPETGNPYTYDEWRNNVGDIRTDDVPNTNLDGSKFVPPTDPVPEEPQSIEDFDESKYFDSDDNDPNDPPVPPTTDGNGPTVSPTNNGGSNIPPKENIPTKRFDGGTTIPNAYSEQTSVPANQTETPTTEVSNGVPSEFTNSSKFVNDVPEPTQPSNTPEQHTVVPNAYSEQTSVPANQTETPTTEVSNGVPNEVTDSSKFVNDVPEPTQPSNAPEQHTVVPNAYSEQISVPVNQNKASTINSSPRTLDDLNRDNFTTEDTRNFNQAAVSSSQPQKTLNNVWKENSNGGNVSKNFKDANNSTIKPKSRKSIIDSKPRPSSNEASTRTSK